jgi:hypothetical protein
MYEHSVGKGFKKLFLTFSLGIKLKNMKFIKN